MGALTLTAPPAEDVAADPNRIITILSPKGGAGKTTAATNLAVGLAKHHPKDVVLVDLDLQFGDVASNLRLSPASTITDVVRRWPCDTTQLKLALTPHHTGLYTLCAPLNPAEADEITAEHVSGIIRALHRSFTHVVVDTDPGLTERVLSALDVSTDMVMICSTEVPSIRGLKKALDALDVIGLTSARRLLVLNRSDARVGVDVDALERTVGQRVDVRVPSSIDMVLATNDGVPVMESERNPELVRAFQGLVHHFVGSDGDGSGGRSGMRLFKRKASG
jgi:pilus assembly protein CpaE